MQTLISQLLIETVTTTLTVIDYVAVHELSLFIYKRIHDFTFHKAVYDSFRSEEPSGLESDRLGKLSCDKLG